MGEAPAIVVDLGSAFTRADYGGDSEPISTVHTVAGRPRSTTLGTPFRGPQAPPCIGSTAFKHAAQLQIRYPVENRVITSFDDLEFFLHTLWADELRVTIEKYPLLVTLSSLCADQIRERLCEMVMEKFNVPAFYCASPAAMALYAAGVTSGIVLDSGDAGTVAMPVFQCFSMRY
jgi:actin-related protein